MKPEYVPAVPEYVPAVPEYVPAVPEPTPRLLVPEIAEVVALEVTIDEVSFDDVREDAAPVYRRGEMLVVLLMLGPPTPFTIEFIGLE